MDDSEQAKVEIDLLDRLKEALAGAYFGENATAEDVRGFLYRSFDALSIVARQRAGLPAPRQQ